MYRICLLGPGGQLAKVRRTWADTTEDALAAARDMLEADARLSGFELWRGGHRIHEESRKKKRRR
jgi:hypothetical protein